MSVSPKFLKLTDCPEAGHGGTCFNPSPGEAEAGEMSVQVDRGLCNKTLFQNKDSNSNNNSNKCFLHLSLFPALDQIWQPANLQISQFPWPKLKNQTSAFFQMVLGFHRLFL